MALPDGNAGKVLALALCGLVVMLVYAAVGVPLIRLHLAMQEEQADLNMQRTRLQRLERQVPALRTAVADMKQRTDQSSMLLPGASDTVAAAALQTQLAALAAAESAPISSVESLSPKVQDGFRRIGVRVVVTADLEQFTGILRTIASARPPLFVDNLEMRNNGIATQQNRTAGAPLNVGMDVYGFRADTAQAVGAQ
jgi:general secretion pathway protein M